MHNFQLSGLTMDPQNQRQFLPPLLPFINPFTIQQLLEYQANTLSLCEAFNRLSLCTSPVYHGLNQYEYLAPSSGPSRTQHNKGSSKAEAQYLNNITHELSGRIAGDRSTGTTPGHAWIGANDNTGAGKV
jgi:hypothetical protein